MQPSTSNLDSTSIIDSYLNSTEDCQFLLRALEKQAFENVVFAFRAQGPLTKYTELLLDHLKTALSIDDDEFNIKIRIASNNPHICRIAQRLNPSYDNDTRWISLAYDLTGIELAKIRRMGAVSNDQKLLSKHIRELHDHNNTLPLETDALSLLMALPKQPYVPERLRKFLFSSQSIDGRISTEKEEKVDLATKKPTKNGVGRPRKRKRMEEEKLGNKEEPRKGIFEKDPKEDTLKEKRKKEGLEKELNEVETLRRGEQAKKCASDALQNVKRTPFYKQRTNDATKMAENITHLKPNSRVEKKGNNLHKFLPKSFYLPSENYPTSSSSRPHHCNNLDIGKRKYTDLECELSIEKQPSDFDNVIKTNEQTRRREGPEKTFDCARVRPFHKATQPKTRGTGRRPTLNAFPIASANDVQLANCQEFYAHFYQNTKYCGQTPVRIVNSQCNSGQNSHSEEVLKLCKSHVEGGQSNEATQISHGSNESVPSSNVSFVAHSSRQSLTALNAMVEADHTYDKASPSFPIGKNGANDNDSPALPAIVGKCDASVTDHAEIGLIASNGICTNETSPSNHLSTLSTLDLQRTNEFITNQLDQVVETSGLDFLASTASLLAPMKSTAIKCNDKISATSQG